MIWSIILLILGKQMIINCKVNEYSENIPELGLLYIYIYIIYITYGYINNYFTEIFLHLKM